MQKFDRLVNAINSELKKAERAYALAKKSALEIAASAAGSPSQSGDRFHSQGSADLAKQKYEVMLSLKNEVEKKGKSICKDYDGETIFLVDNPVMISGFKIVSTKSPLGEKLLSQ